MENRLLSMSEKMIDLQTRYLQLQEQSSKDVQRLQDTIESLANNSGLSRRNQRAPDRESVASSSSGDRDLGSRKETAKPHVEAGSKPKGESSLH